MPAARKKAFLGKVRVTRSSLPGYWYASRIGEEFEVEEEGRGFFVVRNDAGWHGHQYSISAGDCIAVGALKEARLLPALSDIEVIPEPMGNGYQARIRGTVSWERGKTEAEAAGYLVLRLQREAR